MSTPVPDLAKYRELFNRAFPDEPEKFDEIEAAVKQGRAYIEVSPDGKSFAIVQPVMDLHVWTVGGTLRGCLGLEEDISRRAAIAGFDRMTALPSRSSWDLVLMERGWKEEAVKPLVKELA